MLPLDTWLSSPGVLMTNQTATVIFSMFAGIAWLTSATGRRLFHKWPWFGTAPLIEDPIERANYQAHWNTLAALFAAIAAIAQALATLPQIGVLAKNLP
jgi:hypothetical protein